MTGRDRFKAKGPTLIALAWLLFTASLVIWWWIFGLHTASDSRIHRMILWEGGFLVLFVLIGGSALVHYTKSHAERHLRLKLFFSTFTHDLKTSISRLRLQAEILQEELGPLRPQSLEKLLNNIQRLDIQLENSLWMASVDERTLIKEQFTLSELLTSLRPEFPDLQIDLEKDVQLNADRRALQVVIRNIFQNSIIHGEASKIFFRTRELKNAKMRIEITDNGKGLAPHIRQLGEEPLKGNNSQSNGIGLYLSKKLLRRMNGSYEYQMSPSFTNVLLIGGSAL